MNEWNRPASITFPRDHDASQAIDLDGLMSSVFQLEIPLRAICTEGSITSPETPKWRKSRPERGETHEQDNSPLLPRQGIYISKIEPQWKRSGHGRTDWFKTFVK
ncbi:MAG: hypothetical protein ABIS50_13620 [Luteolibacter sp.]